MPREIAQIFRVNMIPKVHGYRVRGGFVGTRDVLTREYQYFRFRDGMDLERAGIALGAKEDPILPHELLQIGFTKRGVERELLRVKIEDRSNVEINNIIDRIALRASDERTTDDILCAVLWRTGDEFDVLKPYNPIPAFASLKHNPKEFFELAIAFFDNDPQMRHIHFEELRRIRERENGYGMALMLERKKPVTFEFIPGKDIRNYLAACFLGFEINRAFNGHPEKQGSFLARVLQFASFPLPKKLPTVEIYSKDPITHFVLLAADNLYKGSNLSSNGKKIFIESAQGIISKGK